jgi:hypothetical protein
MDSISMAAWDGIGLALQLQLSTEMVSLGPISMMDTSKHDGF